MTSLFVALFIAILFVVGIFFLIVHILITIFPPRDERDLLWKYYWKNVKGPRRRRK